MNSLKDLIVRTLTLWAALSTAAPLDNRATSRVIHTFPNPTWLENFAATKGGNFLTGAMGTSGTEAPLYVVDPLAATTNTTATLLYAFPGANSVLGISELEPNVFVIATSTASLTNGPTVGTSALWCLTLNSASDKGTPIVRKIADLKSAQLINGVTVLNKNTVLESDSLAGAIVSVDVKTGSSKTVHTDSSLAPNLTAVTPYGVNGIKYSAPYLYYTNTQLGVFRVKVDPKTGAAVGSYTKLASLDSPDDMAVARDGVVYVARPITGEVARVGSDGKVTVVAGTAGNEIWRGVTSVTLGRTFSDRNVLYGCTFGGFTADGQGFASGGRVVAVGIA
ncbi:hypothetical protein DM02DRAFT_130745 [Periconia macrospinosa]|uniref:NHL repeat-containing protein n=1 Tax=Periconia macrospinosa TaxID=97972 RepID=A0A2V1DER1_9PLEO|nr:hypothetical protein DM02DRAFT_130745 [Periconia macrospinosa]